MQSDPSSREDLNYCHHVVLFVDVLAQMEAMKGINSIPNTPDEHAAFIRHLKNSAGIVDGIRTSIRSFVDSFLSTPPSPLVAMLSPEQRKSYENTRRGNISIQQFSDTVLAFSPLSDQLGPTPRGVYLGIAAACTVMLTTLAAGVVVRGSIDVGLGMEWQPKDLYGPVLHQVYRLEKDVAQYPRIVVGDGLIGYLLQHANSTQTDDVSVFNKEMAANCLALMCHDVDGIAFVDFLGPHFRSIMGDMFAPDLPEQCAKFVNREYARFIEKRDQKHSLRYHMLMQYISARLQHSAAYPTLSRLLKRPND